MFMASWQSLLPLLETVHTDALVLGTGGSSKAVAFGLKKMGIDFRFVSRNPEMQNELSYADLDKDLIHLHKIIINCTPVGMFPNVDECSPLPLNTLLRRICFSISSTILMRHCSCKRKSSRSKNKKWFGDASTAGGEELGDWNQ